jgi:multiple sugar transport system permease protein/putative aldouronate transport system permease protein
MKKSKLLVNSSENKFTKAGFQMFLLVLPFLILSFLFSYYPLYGWVYAFFDYKPPLSLSQCDFVGIRWFKMLYTNKTQVSQLVQVIQNTFAMSLIGIATSFLPMIFAVFLNEIKSKKYRNLVQTLTTVPNFISWVLVYSVAFSIFTNSGLIRYCRCRFF